MTRCDRLAVATAALLVATAAFWNGYPLVFSDTGTYVDSSFGLRVPRDRPLFYGIFLLATHVKLTLWTTLLAQTTLVSLVTWRVVRACAPGCGPAGFVAIAAILSVATGLPWVAGQLVPDFFAGVGVLCLFLILFHDARLGRRERRLLAALLVLSIVVHSSHLLVALALVLGNQLLRWISPRTTHGAARDAAGDAGGDGQRLAWLALAIAFLLVPTVNLVRSGRVFFSEASDAFLLGRLVEDGIARRLLAEHCATEAYALCPYRDQLPATAVEFLWTQDGPFERLGGWSAPPAELRRMIVDSLRFYPAMHVSAVLSGVGRQLVAFRTGDGLKRYGDDTWVSTVLRRRFRHEAWMFEASRQQRGNLPRDALATFHGWVTWASLAASLALLGLPGLAPRPRARGDARSLHAFVWAALVVNAATVATFSSVHHRYQARLIWLVTLAVLVSIAARLPPRAAARPPWPGDGAA